MPLVPATTEDYLRFMECIGRGILEANIGTEQLVIVKEVEWPYTGRLYGLMPSRFELARFRFNEETKQRELLITDRPAYLELVGWIYIPTQAENDEWRDISLDTQTDYIDEQIAARETPPPWVIIP